jgi:hypothetical protein
MFHYAQDELDRILKVRMDVGHMEGDWCDHDPDTNRV